jgi:transcriptional regulator with XRE-family HTH domain
MITAAQIKTARGLLNWTCSDLAEISKVPRKMIQNIEYGNCIPQEAIEEALIAAFLAAGVEFLEEEGVRLVKDSVSCFEGSEGFKIFVDLVYDVAIQPCSAKGGDKPICASNFSDDLFARHLGDYLSFHIERMNMIPNLNVRILQDTEPKTRGSTYRNCRKSVATGSGDVPRYVFGDNLAILVLSDRGTQIVVLSSAAAAKTYREYFDVLWKYATPIAET